MNTKVVGNAAYWKAIAQWDSLCSSMSPSTPTMISAASEQTLFTKWYQYVHMKEISKQRSWNLYWCRKKRCEGTKLGHMAWNLTPQNLIVFHWDNNTWSQQRRSLPQQKRRTTSKSPTWMDDDVSSCTCAQWWILTWQLSTSLKKCSLYLLIVWGSESCKSSETNVRFYDED